MNILRHELKANLKQALIWLGSFCALLVLILSMYPAIEQDADAFLKILENYPEELRNAFGMHLETIASILGFYAFALTFTMLIAAIQAMLLGTSIISKEVREKTADFLLTRPVSRSAIMGYKILAGLVILLATNLVLYILNLTVLKLMTNSSFDVTIFTLMTFSILFVQIMFYSIGIVTSVILPKVKSPLALSLGVVFGFFTISSYLATDKDDWTRYLTPFRYFDPTFIHLNKAWEFSFIIGGLLIVIGAILTSLLYFIRKDIHAV